MKAVAVAVSPNRARWSHRFSILAWVVIAALPAGFLGVFFLWPVASLVARGLVIDGNLTFTGFSEVFASPRTQRIIWFTLSTAAQATALTVATGVPGAYILYRCRFPGRGLLRAIVAIPFVLPTVVVGVAFGSLFAPTGLLGFLGLTDSFPAILVAMLFFNYSVVVRTTGTLWARLDPRLGQAAWTLGASPLRSLVTVTLPALLPAVAAGASLVFLFCSTAFGIVMVLGGTQYSTIETEIWYLTTQLLNLPGAAALSITQLLVVAGSLILTNHLQRKSRQDLKLLTDSSAEKPLRWRRDWAPALVTGALVALLVLLPLVNLALRSLRSQSGWTLEYYANLGQRARSRVLLVPVWEAAWNSLVIAVAAMIVAVMIGVLVSLVVSRRPKSRPAARGLAAVEGLFLLPLGVSAVTVGFGYLITLNRPPLDLRTSVVLVPLAQALVALPLVIRTFLPALNAIPERQLQAAASLGAGPWRRLWTIELPQVWRGLGLAAGFAFATSLGEFGATSFLSRPDNPTLPVVIYRLFSRPGEDNHHMALAAATVLALITAAVMAVAEHSRGKGIASW